jgi:hypothetical protein
MIAIQLDCRRARDLPVRFGPSGELRVEGVLRAHRGPLTRIDGMLRVLLVEAVYRCFW